jgi:hypothetical protein
MCGLKSRGERILGKAVYRNPEELKIEYNNVTSTGDKGIKNDIHPIDKEGGGKLVWINTINAMLERTKIIQLQLQRLLNSLTGVTVLESVAPNLTSTPRLASWMSTLVGVPTISKMPLLMQSVGVRLQISEPERCQRA